MREETQQPKLCAICKLPITKEQRPSVQLRNGDELHIDFFNKQQEAARKPN